MQDFLTRHRGWVIFLFAVPVSFLYQRLENLQNWFRRNFLATTKLHDKKVAQISAQVKRAFEQGKKMCTARQPWKTMSPKTATYKEDMAQIPIDLRNILSFDPERRIVKVEPMVTMGDITHHLVPRGYALAVQVEMDDLTVGGLCMGLGIETTSHRFGFLFETIKSFEIVTASGQLINVTRESNPDLFHALPASRGTLGFLVAVELEIVPVKKYMRLNYQPCYSMEEFGKRFEELSHSIDPPAFLEGLVFSDHQGVIMTGEFADGPSGDEKVNAINRWFKPWFYKHVQTFLDQGASVELIPLRHYFHRHTPSIFFQLRDLIPFANQPWYRWLFAWLGAPKISLMKYSTTRSLRQRSLRNRVAQDVIVPMDCIVEGLDLIAHHFDIYPLWICPVRINHHQEWEGLIRNPSNTITGRSYQMFVDLGVYGIPPAVSRGEWNGVETTRKLEKFTREVGGIQMLYADIFMTRSEFEEMYQHTLYRSVREKYHASSAFPELYDKVIPEKWLIDIDKEAEKLTPQSADKAY